MTQDPQFDFALTDEEGVRAEKEKYMRELKLQELFADAPEELKGIVDEAKADPIDDLLFAPGKPEEE